MEEHAVASPDGQAAASSTSNQLSQYLTKVRRDRSDSQSASEAVGRVESVFTELELPWSREPNGDSWKIASDVGTVNAGLDDSQEVLTFSQFIHDWSGKPKKEAEYMQFLLRVNRTTGGACFAIFGDEGQEFLAIVARIAAPNVDKEEVALALESVFRLSDVYEEH